MPAQHESGHPINVANFELLIAHCTGYGAPYNPSQTAIKLPGLNTLLTSTKNALAVVADTLAKLATAQNQRQTLYEILVALTKRLIYALDASGPTQKIVADARSLAKQIYDTGRKKKKSVNPQSPKQISNSHKSFVNRLENFKKLIELYQEEPLYNPNETDLKIASLLTFASQVTQQNSDISTLITNYDNALTSRNHFLYDSDTGLVDIGRETKKYVRSVFGLKSPEYKQISGIKFRKYKI